MMTIPRRTAVLIVAANILTAWSLDAGKLLSKDWTVAGPDGAKIAAAADNDISTAWTSTAPQQEGMALTIDLGKTAVVHRIYLNPGKALENFPRSLRILAGPDAENLKPIQESLLLTDTETNLKFNPAAGRVFRLEIGKETSGFPWSVAELELYGSSDPEAMKPGDAVVVDPKAPAPLQTAARELRYYVGELTGRPIPIIAPDQADKYPGTLYTVVDLAEFAKTYDEMEANKKSGAIPKEAVNVEKEGRKVFFKAWPYANVLNSVWEFLEKQGVRWTYPDEQGDFVPSGKGVDLGVLPLKYSPPSEIRHANFAVSSFGQNPDSDQYLYWWRSRWNLTWGNQQTTVLGGTEVPKPDPAKKPMVGKGFEGYPHNFDTVVPDKVLQEHPEWCGMYRGIMCKDIKHDSPKFGKRLSPEQGGPTFCMSNTELIEWITKKAVDSVNANPDAEGTIWLLPMDAARYCECENCMQLIGKPELDNFIFEFGGWANVSEVYYYFISEIARRVGKALPKVKVGALAYSTVHRPPQKLDRMPDNVRIDICLYGAMTLPLTSPNNSEMLGRLERWASMCGNLGYYSYALIHGDSGNRTPVPLVTAQADWLSILEKHIALSGGSQASEGNQRMMAYNPWNYYAFPHLAWNPALPPETILNDFFSAFYRESSGPMLSYYKTLEDKVIKDGIDMHMGSYGYGPKPEVFTPEILKALGNRLAEAEKAADTWQTKERLKPVREAYDWAATQVARLTSAPENAEKGGKSIYPCFRRAGDIAVDGKLDDEAWKCFPAATGFTTPTKYLPAILRQTEFRMAWDDENLYLAVKCQEPDIANMKIAEGDQYFSDSIEVFLAPAKGSPTTYYRFAVACNGSYSGPTCYVGSMYNPQKAEPVPCKTAAGKGDGFWAVEAAIPFKALGGAPKPGSAWYGNVCRNVRVAGGLAENCTTWSKLPMLNWHFYDEYNSILFIPESMTPEKAELAEKKLNGDFRVRHDELLKRFRQDEETLAGLRDKRNLAVNPKDVKKADLAVSTASSGLGIDRFTAETGGWMIYNNSPQFSQIKWPKPVDLDTIVIRFSGQYQIITDFSVEYHDGKNWRILADEKNNVFPVAVIRTAPVKAERLRLYVYRPYDGYRKVERFEAYMSGK